MIDHLTIPVNDLEKSKKFYLAALKPLGYELIKEYGEWGLAGLGLEGKANIWLHVQGSHSAMHVAFAATDKARVESFHKEGLEAGGKENGAPGYRKDYGAGYFAAFLLDPSSNNIEMVWHDPGAE